MMLDPTEAEKAMEVVQTSTARARELHGYAAASTALIVWGVVWMLANVTSWAAPSYSGVAWMIGIGAGIASSIMAGVRDKPRWAKAAKRATVGRSVLTALVIAIMISAAVSALDLSERGAMTVALSLLVAAGFTGAGLWVGSRYVVLGLALAGLIVFGWFALSGWLELWLGLACGSLLIASGLWFRRA